MRAGTHRRGQNSWDIEKRIECAAGPIVLDSKFVTAKEDAIVDILVYATRIPEHELFIVTTVGVRSSKGKKV